MVLICGSTDASPGCKSLYRRPMLNMQPLLARAVGLIVFLPLVVLAVYIFRGIVLGILDALGLPTLFPLIPVVAFSMFCLLFRSVYLPVRRRLAIFAYIQWLRSFEDEGLRDGRRSIGRTILGYLRQYVPSWRQSRDSSEEFVEEGQIQLR
jgi:uncharacterized protein YacL